MTYVLKSSYGLLYIHSSPGDLPITFDLLAENFCGPESWDHDIYNLPGVLRFLIQSKTKTREAENYSLDFFLLHLFPEKEVVELFLEKITTIKGDQGRR